jgi:hypothetical protein
VPCRPTAVRARRWFRREPSHRQAHRLCVGLQIDERDVVFGGRKSVPQRVEYGSLPRPMTRQGVKMIERGCPYRVTDFPLGQAQFQNASRFPLAETGVCGYYLFNAHRRRSLEAATHHLMCDGSSKISTNNPSSVKSPDRDSLRFARRCLLALRVSVFFRTQTAFLNSSAESVAEHTSQGA